MHDGAILLVTGAPGSGKTAVLADLRGLLRGVVVLDMDEMLPAGSRLAGIDLRQSSAPGIGLPTTNCACPPRLPLSEPDTMS